MNFCSGVLLPKSINDLAKVRYNLAKVKPFGNPPYDLAKGIRVTPNCLKMLLKFGVIGKSRV